MLEGKEGTGSYISGWNSGVEAEMKKLIAYAPINYCVYLKLFWSVAVVAPLSEVEDAVHSVFIRQFYIQASILFAIILGSVYVISFEQRWAKTLEAEVMKKTDDLKNSLEELRKSEEKYKTLVESAEDLIFKDVTTGASSDIERASHIARMMVCRFGMNSVIGPIQYGETHPQIHVRADSIPPDSYGTEVANAIDVEVKKIIDDANNRACEILKTHNDQLEALAQELLEKETLSVNEICELLGMPCKESEPLEPLIPQKEEKDEDEDTDKDEDTREEKRDFVQKSDMLESKVNITIRTENRKKDKPAADKDKDDK